MNPFETLERIGWFPFFRSVGEWTIQKIQSLGVSKPIAGEIFTMLVVTFSILAICIFSIREENDNFRR